MTSTYVTDERDINRNGEKSFELGLEGNRDYYTSDIIEIYFFFCFPITKQSLWVRKNHLIF